MSQQVNNMVIKHIHLTKVQRWTFIFKAKKTSLQHVVLIQSRNMSKNRQTVGSISRKSNNFIKYCCQVSSTLEHCKPCSFTHFKYNTCVEPVPVTYESLFYFLNQPFNCFSVCAARTGQPIVKEGPVHHQWPAWKEAELYEGKISRAAT